MRRFYSAASWPEQSGGKTDPSRRCGAIGLSTDDGARADITNCVAARADTTMPCRRDSGSLRFRSETLTAHGCDGAGGAHALALGAVRGALTLLRLRTGSALSTTTRFKQQIEERGPGGCSPGRASSV